MIAQQRKRRNLVNETLKVFYKSVAHQYRKGLYLIRGRVLDSIKEIVFLPRGEINLYTAWLRKYFCRDGWFVIIVKLERCEKCTLYTKAAYPHRAVKCKVLGTHHRLVLWIVVRDPLTCSAQMNGIFLLSRKLATKQTELQFCML